ncbi:anti-sigma regulatory factor [Amphibacillus xylanus]|uniref:Serine/threonine protein kinase RsbT n=1 Tax=Amphibacillus xylanus (strain ATCC 51415 / DSM 6626 / JCM 7361 / LMG 17667 / NBRC 15112 / Ep01) TaxID=698758 RepID=K0IZV7_AMPXN|nr:anti-sigma regulatory factor [Amphibacillus xylanus]BAM46482.1 serine/threonine protein kinase RsbT [Amphibacillus xylanus NBRC 15112]
MEFKPCVNIHQEIDIVGARQLGRQYAKQLGFNTVDQARIATAISELTRNIYLYAKSGKVCFDVIDQINRKGLKICAIDNGPGIQDIGQVMQDGYSTSGGLGAGLPGVKRLMDQFNIQSDQDGTRIEVIKWVR